MKHGLLTVAAAIPNLKVADVDYNVNEIKRLISAANDKGVEIVVFPELCIPGYSCQDLFRSEALLDKTRQAVNDIKEMTREVGIIVIIGTPTEQRGLLMNSAVVIHNGHIDGVVHKTHLPNYGEFYEKRWFASSLDLNEHNPTLFATSSGVRFGIEICEDLWSPNPPSTNLALSGADVVFNLSATDELIGKHAYLRSLIQQQSARNICGYVYASCGFGESTQDVVYGGNAFIVENGKIIAEARRFSLTPQLVVQQIDIDKLRAERRSNTTFMGSVKQADAVTVDLDMTNDTPFTLYRDFDPLPFIPKSEDMAASCEEILNIQTFGLAKRLHHTHCSNVVVGISGGLDSTLALLVCVRAFDRLQLDRKGIHGITMPGFGTTDRTHDNAVTLMKSLGVSSHEISIVPSVIQHFKDIKHDINVHDVTYENGQARERTQILMDYANKVGGMVIGTGDLSELALGWATYNGDHMSMYGVNASIPKTLIRHLVNYVATNDVDEVSKTTLLDIIDTPISPELIPADENGNIKQKTEDLVGPYVLHDFFLYNYLRFGFSPSKLLLMAEKAFDGSHPDAGCFDRPTILHWMETFFRRFFAQQFKRSCLPDGPKVGSVSLSPRGDWRMPSDASSQLWLKEINEIKGTKL